MTLLTNAELVTQLASELRLRVPYSTSFEERVTSLLQNLIDSSANAALLQSGAGAPENAAQATIGINPAGDDNALTFTAVAYGAAGNGITIEYVDPGANDAVLSVDVVDLAITVNLATDSGGTITTTAADVLAEIEGTPAADALVSVAIDASDTGSGDDGSGLVTAVAATALTGGADGSGLGVLLPGGLYIDTDGGDVYRNSGSTEQPTFTQLADV